MLSTGGGFEKKAGVFAEEHSSGSRTLHTRHSLKHAPPSLHCDLALQYTQEQIQSAFQTHPESHDVHPLAACDSMAAAGRLGGTARYCFHLSIREALLLGSGRASKDSHPEPHAVLSPPDGHAGARHSSGSAPGGAAGDLVHLGPCTALGAGGRALALAGGLGRAAHGDVAGARDHLCGMARLQAGPCLSEMMQPGCRCQPPITHHAARPSICSMARLQGGGGQHTSSAEEPVQPGC